MSATPSSGVPSDDQLGRHQISWTLRRPAISSSRTAWRPSTCSPPRPLAPRWRGCGSPSRADRRRCGRRRGCAAPGRLASASRRGVRPGGRYASLAGVACRARRRRRLPAARGAAWRPAAGPPAAATRSHPTARRLPSQPGPAGRAPATAGAVGGAAGSRLRPGHRVTATAKQAHALAAAERAEPLGPAPLHGDRRTDGCGQQALLHLVSHGRQLRLLADHRAVDVADRPARRRPPRGDAGAAARSSRPRSSAGSVSGKCWPMSPSPAAPSRASATAWATTSASLWPTSPGSPVERAPAEHQRPGRVVAEAVDVEALADPDLEAHASVTSAAEPLGGPSRGRRGR